MQYFYIWPYIYKTLILWQSFMIHFVKGYVATFVMSRTYHEFCTCYRPAVSVLSHCLGYFCPHKLCGICNMGNTSAVFVLADICKMNYEQVKVDCLLTDNLHRLQLHFPLTRIVQTFP